MQAVAHQIIKWSEQLHSQHAMLHESDDGLICQQGWCQPLPIGDLVLTVH